LAAAASEQRRGATRVARKDCVIITGRKEARRVSRPS